jgi:hypothetical protein
MEMPIVLRPDRPDFLLVGQYYAGARKEIEPGGVAPVDRVERFVYNFESLVQRMITLGDIYYIVATHGDPERGLTMPLTAATNVSAGYAMPRLLELMKRLDIEERTGQPVDAEFLRGTARDWNLRKELVLRVAQRTRQLRNMPGVGVFISFRACNIGRKEGMLETMRKVFGCLALSAPTCRMFFVPVHPAVMSDARAQRTNPDGTRRHFPSPVISSLTLDINERHQSMSYIANRGSLGAWANAFTMGWFGAVTDTFPVALMWVPAQGTYYLPFEQGYRDQLRVVIGLTPGLSGLFGVVD